MRATVPGGELYYESVGHGPVMLLMHMGLGLDHSYLRPWLDPLGRDVTLAYYDLRGNGRSSRPRVWDKLDVRDFTEDAEALRRHLRAESVIVFGHSYGGMLAQAYARAYPEHVAALILCCTYPALDFPEVAFANASARATPDQLAALQQAFSPPIGDDETWATLARAILPIYFHAFDPERHGNVLDAVRFSAGAYDRSAALLPQLNSLPWLHEITAPALVLSGADDWLSPTALGARRLVDRLPRAELVEFRRSGHFPFVEENSAFLETVGSWLQGVIH